MQAARDPSLRTQRAQSSVEEARGGVKGRVERGRLPETGTAALPSLSLGTDLHFTAVCSVFPRRQNRVVRQDSLRKKK